MRRSPTRGPAGQNIYKASCPEPLRSRSSSIARPVPQSFRYLVGYGYSAPALRLPLASWLHRRLCATFVVAPQDTSRGAMWRTQKGRAVARALVLATLCLGVTGRPLIRRSLSDEGPLYIYGWNTVTRVQYLYVAGPHISNCFLYVRSDGFVGCEDDQNKRSECLPVGPFWSLKPPGTLGRALYREHNTPTSGLPDWR